MKLAIIIILLWAMCGFFGYISEENETFEICNFYMVIFLVMFPMFPFIFHWCGLF